MEKPTKLLIDGDGILYRCGFAVEKTQYLVANTLDPTDVKRYDNMRDIPDVDPLQFEIWSRKKVEPLENALFLTKTVITKILEKYSGTSFDLWLTPSVGNFRDQIAKSFKYKGNREATNRPKYYKDIREFLVRTYGAKFAEGQEADDELGIGATNDPSAIIVSNDKDLRQVPGNHFSFTPADLLGIFLLYGTRPSKDSLPSNSGR